MPHCPNSIERAILLATINDLETPHFLAPVIAAAAKSTHEHLVIVLFSRLFNTGRKARRHSQMPAALLSPPQGQRRRADSIGSVNSDGSSPGVSHTARWDEIQRLLTYVYVQATKVAQDMDKVLMEVDVLLRGFDEELHEDFGEGMEIAFRVEGGMCDVACVVSCRVTD